MADHGQPRVGLCRGISEAGYWQHRSRAWRGKARAVLEWAGAGQRQGKGRDVAEQYMASGMGGAGQGAEQREG